MPTRNLKHGHNRAHRPSREYVTWTKMKSRCENINDYGWNFYGGRGIKVCARWSKSFAAFLSDMGERPRGKSIDRVDNSKGYRPGNCRWATPLEQAWNSRKVKLVLVHGRAVSLRAAAKILRIDRSTFVRRMMNGMGAQEAVDMRVDRARSNAVRRGWKRAT